MSGPICFPTESAIDAVDHPEHCAPEVITGREATVGAVTVNRLIPRRARRMVGSWCFVDHMLPVQLAGDAGLDVGPHPHIGLQTVTWLIKGQILHRDSLGSEQLIRPGQLNLMTAGNGVSHSEETRGIYTGELEGLQFWVAQPEQTRHGAAAFEHHEDLPRVDIDRTTATVMVGSLDGVTSPARTDTAIVGAELAVRQGETTVPLRSDFEYAVVVVDGAVAVGSTTLTQGVLGYLGTGLDELHLQAAGSARALLIGGEPFSDELTMWWNYVARSRDEITRAHLDWTTPSSRLERFGLVESPLERIDVPGPPWA